MFSIHHHPRGTQRVLTRAPGVLAALLLLACQSSVDDTAPAPGTDVVVDAETAQDVFDEVRDASVDAGDSDSVEPGDTSDTDGDLDARAPSDGDVADITDVDEPDASPLDVGPPDVERPECVVSADCEAEPCYVATCDDGECTSALLVCSDDDPCTNSSCNPETGECMHVIEIGLPCDDGDSCTVGDKCSVSGCFGGPSGTPECTAGEGCLVPVQIGALPFVTDGVFGTDQVPPGCLPAGGSERVFRHVAAVAGQYRFWAPDALVEPNLVLSASTSCEAGCIAATDTSAPGASHELRLTLAAGETVWLRAEPSAVDSPATFFVAFDLVAPAEVVCDDGGDDDGDGATDCVDLDCLSTPACAAQGDACTAPLLGTLPAPGDDPLTVFVDLAVLHDLDARWECDGLAGGEGAADATVQLNATVAGEYVLATDPPGHYLYLRSECDGSCQVRTAPTSVVLASGESVRVTIDPIDVASVGPVTLSATHTPFEVDCTDLLDDDADGVTDCADPQCWDVDGCSVPGDTCAAAAPWTGPVSGALSDADVHDRQDVCESGLPERFFQWVAPSTGTFRLTVAGAVAGIALSCGPAWTCVPGGQDLEVQAGDTYWVAVEGSGEFDVSIDAVETSCADGLDDDGDGATDCDDTDCPVSVAPECAGGGITCDAPVIWPVDLTGEAAFPSTMTGAFDPASPSGLFPASLCRPWLTWGTGPHQLVRFTAPETARYTLRLAAEFDGGLLLATACPPTLSECADAGDDPDAVSAVLQEGQEVTVAIVGVTPNDNGAWSLTMEQGPVEAVCTGGTDEDGDGLVDCEDPDCEGIDVCSAPLSNSCGNLVSLTPGQEITWTTFDPQLSNQQDPFWCAAAGFSGSSGRERWLGLSAVELQRVRVTLDPALTTFDAWLYASLACPLESDTCIGGTEVAGNGGESLEMEVGPTYESLVVVDSISPTAMGSFRLVTERIEWACDDGLDDDQDAVTDCDDPDCAHHVGCAVEGDICETAIPLVAPAESTVDTSQFTNATDASCGSVRVAAAPDVWWSCTAPEAGTYAVTIQSADFGSTLQTVGSCGQGCLAGQDIAGLGGERLELELAGGESVYFVVDGSGAKGARSGLVTVRCEPVETDCGDGLDGDGDGVTDCGDPDCFDVGGCTPAGLFCQSPVNWTEGATTTLLTPGEPLECLGEPAGATIASWSGAANGPRVLSATPPPGMDLMLVPGGCGATCEPIVDRLGPGGVESIVVSSETPWPIVLVSNSGAPGPVSLAVRALESTCSDGIDNDLDGARDCADADCQESTDCAGVGESCAQAIPLGSPPWRASLRWDAFGDDIGECGGAPGESARPEAVLQFTAPVSTMYRVALDEGTDDTSLLLYSTCPGIGVPCTAIADNDAASGEVIVIGLLEGQTVYIVVERIFDLSGGIEDTELTVDYLVAP